MTTLQAVELGVLGPLQVRQDGAPVAIPGAKPRAVLTMLGLHHGSVVAADTLVELLWGEDPPRTAAKALQTHISALRRVLGDGFVLTQGTGWAIAESEVDASRYKSAARLGRDAAATGDISQAVAHFEEALGLWRGIPELPDSRRGSSEKTRWIEGHAALVEDRADALLATARAAEIIGELEAAVAEAPLRERRWGQLMLALYRAGRQGDALGAYQRARTLLADELGIDPGPELRRLETAIVAQDASLDVVVAQQLPSVMRAVTFLLTDIEGSTAAWEADAEAMAVALARHDELVEQVVTSRGGRLIKTRGEGDATFSVFERPSAAAAAAMELQDAIIREQWGLREPMRIRIALHTGEVELRDGDYFGRAVNRAARLRSLAIGGQILCSGATAELVIDSLPDDVVLADLGLRELRNLARPEHVFELRLETAEESAQPPTSDAPMERPVLPSVLIGTGPFVGRESELDRLLSAWQTSLGGGACAALIAGEPGVGKTRLAGEWSRQAYEQGAVVLYGRCDEDLGAPYQPFAEALRSMVPCVGTSRLRGLRGVEALLPLVPGLVDEVPDLAAPTRADPDTERYALFDAVVALLEMASTEAPVVLVLDDLHWAAKPTLLLLRHLLRFGDRARVQIVGTYRSTDLDRSHPLAAMLADLHRDGTANRISLGGLDEDDVSAYVAKAGYDDEELGHALASVTGGNPFFLIEALRHVDESGGVWDPSTLPQGVREAVSRRLSRLPIETNKALATAAVVGSRFALDLVERVVGDDLVDAFDEASKAGIVIEEPGGRYRFNHAIVRQSLLAELPSMRRMRLHQRIATTLEEEPGADDELLAELAHHYFECAWAGNAAKAVEYCRRAADQAMARLAYEGAAELYDHAVHALEELDDELPDRDDQNADLLVARCEALLAAGDVASAVGAVSQLQQATVDSARLSAWATCFDGQLSVLVHPERLDDVEAALDAAAHKLAEIDDAAGEAKAHTVRATCLARLGRIGDCEIALDDALTAARRAREHRRVNAVLAGAPLAALWGPNPVPRAGGRCLDVVRLLRITTDSPAVEATSTRCQAVLEAFRGRDAAARRMIDSARRTVTELGLRHALLEVEQFAGIVELVLGDPAAAEPHLRQACNGFRRMGLDADTAETAALLGRACLALNRDAEADELCTESERLAGHALKASIAWRTLRAQLLSRSGEHDEARRVAQAAITLAERTDGLVDHGDACLSLARVLGAAGDAAGARAAAERAANLYERKGAAALADKARSMLDERVETNAPTPPEVPVVEAHTAAVHASERVMAAIAREAWDEFEQMFAPEGSVESRRKIVGFKRTEFRSDEVIHQTRRDLETGIMRANHVVIAVRGERLALARMTLGTADASPGAPQDEFLYLYGVDDQGRINLQIWFDLADMDAAIAELDALQARFEEERSQARRLFGGRELPSAPASVQTPVIELDTACVRAGERVAAAVNRGDWDEYEGLFAPEASLESRRKIVGFTQNDIPFKAWQRQNRRILETGEARLDYVFIAVRGERLALSRLKVGTDDASHGAPTDEFLQVYGIDEEDRVAFQIWFDVEDIDAAIAELDALHAQFEEERSQARRLENAASRVFEREWSHFAARDWDALAELVADNYSGTDHRRVVRAENQHGRDVVVKDLQAAADVGFTISMLSAIAIRGERLVLARVRASGRDPNVIQNDALNVIEIDAEERIVAAVTFDLEDFDAAIAELESRYTTGEAAAYARTWSVIAAGYAGFNRRELLATTPDWVSIDHRRGAAFAPGDMIAYIRAAWDDSPDTKIYIGAVHRLSEIGAVVTHLARGISQEGFDAEWRDVHVLAVEGDMFSRAELFDEADLDAAIARFDQLSRPATRLENAASRANERTHAYFAARDWDSLAEIVADDISTDDRRRVVNAGLLHGRDASIESFRWAADLGVTHATSDPIATRGERLVLTRARYSHSDDQPQPFDVDLLHIVEINADERIGAVVIFDLEDFDAALAELDARYLAGEAAAYLRTWSVISGSYAAINRHELPLTTPDCVNIDRRREIAMGVGDLIAIIGAGPDRGQDYKAFVEAVHRLIDTGAVVTYAAYETSQEGFDAEWRGIAVLTVDGDMVSRTEVFDAADLDAAIASFEELSQPVPRLENAASRVDKRFQACFAARDWEVMAEMLSDGFSIEDRRRVVNMGNLQGRDAELGVHAYAVVGSEHVTSTVIATRAQRLALSHYRFSDRDQRPDAFRIEMLVVVEIDAHDRMAAVVVFDADDINAAIAELDARYVAGEAAAHSETWLAIAEVYASLNRGEMPATAPDLVDIDHRSLAAIGSGDLMAYLQAASEDGPRGGIYIEAVHRLTDLGAVTTHVAKSTSREGFDAEWRITSFFTVSGDLVNRYEVFDEADLEDAIARFEELSRPAAQLENAAAQAYERIEAHFAARDWDAMAVALADEVFRDDRRRVVGAELRKGRDAVVAEFAALAEIGVKRLTFDTLAIRGSRLALSRARALGRDSRADAFRTDVLSLAELDAEERIAAIITFDPDDFDAAIAELDARYLASEGAAHAHVWSVITDGFASMRRYEVPPTTPDCVSIDHRRTAAFAPGELNAYFRAAFDLTADVKIYVEAVHRLNDVGTVCTHVTHGVSHDGFAAEWREVDVLMVEGNIVNHCELFDEADIDAALAKFEELTPHEGRLKNAASQVAERFMVSFTEGDWGAIAEMLADNFSSDDRRRVVGAGVRLGRDAQIADVRAIADLWIMRPTVMATRGDRLVLMRVHFSGRDQGPEAFVTDVLGIVEINADERIVGTVAFGIDDIDAAFEELDARYLAGEAAAHARTWSVIARGNAAANRNAKLPMTLDSSMIDHRLRTTLNADGITAYVRATWDLTPELHMFIESVHRLNDVGAVVTHASRGTSQDDFEAEWRQITLFTVDGDLCNRCEIFDEANLDAALARFAELRTQARRVENAASQVSERFLGHFAVSDWDAMAEILADNFFNDDRRPLVSFGVLHGRDAQMANMRAVAELLSTEVTSTVIATRAARLALVRLGFSVRGQGPDAFQIEVLGVVGIDTEDRIAAFVVFDTNDLEGATAELEARYLAGEGAVYSHTWSVISQAYAALNRRALPATTRDWTSVDHRHFGTIEPNALTPNIRAFWDITSEARIDVATVHRLTNLGAVVAHATHATSQEGVEIESGEIIILMVDGDLLSRCEIFNEADLDAALARFEKLHPLTPRLENPASQLTERFQAHFAARDWAAMGEILADGFSSDDRRRVVGAGVRDGRHAEIADMAATADLEITNVTSTVVATRGGRLALMRGSLTHRDQGPEAYLSEALGIVEIDAYERIVAFVTFDLDDIDAAFAELEARYLAGEAATHAQTWSLVVAAYAAFDRHELPAADWVTVDHRRATPFASSTMTESLRAIWDLTPALKIHIEAVHRLNSFGAVITHEGHGSSQEGFDAEWRAIDLLTVEGGRITGCEIFDEADLDAALARFDELQPRPGRLEHPVQERFLAHFAARDWDAMGRDFADDYYCDDRRRVVNAGVRHGRDAAFEDLRVAAEIGLMTNITSDIIATRGEHLFLGRTRWVGPDQRPGDFYTEVLNVIETDPEERIAAQVLFDPNDIGNIAGAFNELDARYLAGEAAAHAHTWSLVTEAFAAVNRHELPELTPDWVNVDHRRGAAFAAGEMTAYIHDLFDDVPDIHVYVEVVHRLGDLGAVVTQAGHGTSQKGFQAEWREIGIFMFDGQLVSRCELFDEADLDAALARFDELQTQARRVENAATQVTERFLAQFAAGDWDAMPKMMADNFSSDDRRRVVGAGVRHGRNGQIMDMRAIADLGITHSNTTHLATRGKRLALSRTRMSAKDQPFYGEMLDVLEINADAQIVKYVLFDPDDVDAAIAELDARYLAGEAADHAHTWALSHAFTPGSTDTSCPRRRRTLLTSTTVGWQSSRRVTSGIRPYRFRSNSGPLLPHRSRASVEQPRSSCHSSAAWNLARGLRGGVVRDPPCDVEGDLFNRSEIFDEANLDAAHARFEELHPQAPRLANAASQVVERFWKYFAARHWDAMAEAMADDFCTHDRRRVANAGVLQVVLPISPTCEQWPRSDSRAFRRPSSRPAGSALRSFAFAPRCEARHPVRSSLMWSASSRSTPTIGSSPRRPFRFRRH